MVLESLIRPFTAEKRPWELFFYGILISSLALFLGFWVFREEAGLVTVFFTVFACIPLMFHAIRNEERKDIMIDEETTLLKEHSRVVAFFVFLFLGLVVSFTLWFIFLPEPVSQELFSEQLETIGKINNASTGHAVNFGFFSRIFFNNMRVLFFCTLFAFFYGAGAIFILTWNATVIATAIGTLIKTMLETHHWFLSGSIAFSRYLIHGVPEMLGYMIAGLAGGIISAAVINHDFKTEGFHKVIIDASILLIVAILVLLVAAVIEAFVTPALFY